MCLSALGVHAAGCGIDDAELVDDAGHNDSGGESDGATEDGSGGDPDAADDAQTDTETDTEPDTESDADPDTEPDTDPDTEPDTGDDADVGDDTPDASTGTRLEGTVGPEGATTVGQGVRIEVPAGAVNSAVTITASVSTAVLPEAIAAMAPVLAFGPDGTVFDAPVRVCFAVSGPPAAGNGAVFGVTDDGGATWSMRDAAIGAPEGDVAYWCGTTRHFTGIGLGERPSCPPTGQIACNDGSYTTSTEACGEGCRFGAAVCDGVCAPVDFDPANCGGCGLACDAGLECRGGTCACPAATPALCGDGTCAASAFDCPCVPPAPPPQTPPLRVVAPPRYRGPCVVPCMRAPRHDRASLRRPVSGRLSRALRRSP